MVVFKYETRAKGGLCNELHIKADTYQIDGNSMSATVQPEDYADIVAKLQSAVCLSVVQRQACPAHDSKLWSEIQAPKFTIVKFLWKGIMLLLSLIYIICPPWPPFMARKIVFCHPPRASYYYLIGVKDGKKKACFYASEARDMEKLSICLPQMIHPKIRAVDVYYHLLRCKVFTLPFKKNNYFVAMELYCEQSIRWLHRDRKRTRIRSPNLIIFSQPNSSDLGCCLMMDPNFADIADFLQCDMLIFDYPGYGVSDGTANEKNIYACIDAVMKYATEDLGYPTENIILIGFSLGTAAMIHLAENHKVAALILIAPFTSFMRIVFRCPGFSKRCRSDMFPSLEKSTKISSPTLICHGEKDVIVSPEHGVQLQKNITDCELYLLQHASHQGIFCEREMWDKVEEFLGTRVGITRNWVDRLQNESTFSEISEVTPNNSLVE